ncbi:MAG: Crp/Fnr family transcriptional regulator, partial [Bradymonadaceae bacterium]
MATQTSDKSVVQCPAGTVLFREGETGKNMFVVKSGRVRLRKSVHNSDVVVDELGAGAFCGELALINDQPRPVTATVIEDASLLKVGAGQFEKMVRKNPDIAVRMLKKMGQRLTEAQFKVSNLILRTPEGRLLRQLRQEAIRAGDDDDPTSKAPIPDDLADALALEIGEVKELLNGLVNREMISVDDKGYFEIVDPEAYDRYLSYLELQDR